MAEKQDIKENLETLKTQAAEVGKRAVKEDWLYLKRKDKGILDSFQEKMVSRKLLVFITSTVLMWYGLDADTWAMIAICYIGGQSAIDIAKVWRGPAI